MKNLPNFLIIGPPKCASTSLHYYLGQHPEIYVSPVKETNFFTHDFYKGLDYYSNYFADAGKAKAIGEATPSYFFLPFAADRIKKDIPDVKLIVTFRNPIERAFSHWLMFREAGVENASFKDAININLKQMENADFIGDRGAELWDNRKYTTSITSQNENWLRIYIQPGMYAKHLSMLYERFDQNQVHIIFMEDLKNNFQETIKNLFRFIGVNENFKIPSEESQNFYFNKKYFRLVQKVVGIRVVRYISAKLPGNLKNLFRQKKDSVKNIPEISEEDRAFLSNFFKSDIKQLEKITNRSLGHWLSNNMFN